MITEQPEAPGPEPTQGGRGDRVKNIGNVFISSILEGSSAVVTILAFFLALVVGGLLIVFSDPAVLHAWSQFFSAPGTALSATWTSVFDAYKAMFEGSIFNPATINNAFYGESITAIFYPILGTIAFATPLILTGLSVALAFRVGLFNIGAAGQWIGGAIVAVYLGLDVSLPIGLHVIVCVLGAFAGGAVIGWLVGLLKARTGAHEVIVTIMLNYVMYSLLQYVLSSPNMLQEPHQNNQIAKLLPSSALLPALGGPPPQVNAGFLIALAAAVGVGWLLNRSTLGFQFRTVGANPSAARTAGMSVERSWVLVMLIAGGLAGLSSATILLGQPPINLVFNSYGTYGFDGITVALLGRARPLGVVLAGLLFGALATGGTAMASQTTVPTDIVQVIEALIVLFVAAPPFIRAVFRLRRARGGIEAVAKGWNG